ncbi:leishmanolysin-related zinc metalloendopeptidase [Albimonas pacifica]|uniref:VPLPA-CTERM protein sorting domain-containing protein n=1 Tax=Albimonas pacifica TaxID=1114924 RepID=A0A1I3JQU9_9RHOB|nr:leishmanolysin-related zinc metalloendopeptidase [Albimonas pacifica]SFI62632.1 VPLPA-CTERM protein sorting domain-containing protein [Albimonas pacifica]
MSCFRPVAAALAASLWLAAPAAAYTVNPGGGAYDALKIDGYGTFQANLLASADTQPLTSEIVAAATQAKTTLDGLITGYATQTLGAFYDTYGLGGAPALGYDFEFRLTDLDGDGGTLAQALVYTPITDGDFVLPYAARIEIDAADLTLMNDASILADVLLHEMIHGLGFSSYFWEANGLLAAPDAYVGSYALAAYDLEYPSAGGFIPLEDVGGAGTAGSHWDEEGFGNSASDSSFSGELMTGFIGAEGFLSQTSIFSLQDIGYALGGSLSYTGPFGTITAYAAPVPVPAAGGLLASALLGLAYVKRRRREA